MEKLLNSNLDGRVGLGCMGMSEFYGETDEKQSLETLLAAFEMGYRHYDTADMYGRGHNEQLLGKFLDNVNGKRHEVVIASKIGIERDPSEKYKISVNNSASYLREACEASLKRLATDYIDILYLHRLDPALNIEEPLEIMQELQIQGKIRGIGLCEVSAKQLKDANDICTIDAVQAEYSLWTRDCEKELIPLCEKLGIPFVAYSPLGRGFFTGNINDDFIQATDDSVDFRARLPRFLGENMQKNKSLLVKLDEVTRKLDIEKSEIALSWILHKSPNIFIIPGTKRQKYLRNNYNSQLISLDNDIIELLDRSFDIASVAGERYPTEILKKSTV